MSKYRVKFIEETCHTYEVEAESKEDAERLAGMEYLGCRDEEEEKALEGKEDRINFIGEEPEANELISCEVVDE